MDFRRVWVAGHTGMVGSALCRALEARGTEVLKVGRQELDLRDQARVYDWLEATKPDAIIFSAAKVGGILANDSYPADFIHDNLVIQSNVIHGAHLAGVNRLVFLGSSCIYPKFAEQPIKEESLLTGALEPTNEWYAVAKIAGLKMCQAYRKQYGRSYVSVMPCNLYGVNDHFDLNNSHVLPALLRKLHTAKLENSPNVVVWGTGSPLREFLYVDDLASAVVFCLDNYDKAEHINIGSGNDVSIGDLARLIKRVVGYDGELTFDVSKPDGTPRKLMDSSRIRALGWEPKWSLERGIAATYRWYRDTLACQEDSEQTKRIGEGV